jgi:hypothetical protein
MLDRQFARGFGISISSPLTVQLMCLERAFIESVIDVHAISGTVHQPSLSKWIGSVAVALSHKFLL